jgi:hypothetical protein
MKSDPALNAIGEIEQTLLRRWLVKKRPAFQRRSPTHGNTRMPREGVEMFQSVFAQQIVNDQAALAAKGFFVANEGMIRARFTTMKTRRADGGGIFAFARQAGPARGSNSCQRLVQTAWAESAGCNLLIRFAARFADTRCESFAGIV